MRIVFINLHANEMLVKTAPKYVFKQSVAIKHKYLLDYLLGTEDIEVCSYINDRGFSLMHNGSEGVLKFLNLFRFIEHKIILKKNGIDPKKVTVLRRLKDIKTDDIVICYQLYEEQYRKLDCVDAFRAVSMVHYSGDSRAAELMKKMNPDCLIGESNLQKNSKSFQTYYSFYRNAWVVHPFVFAERFQNKKPFGERKNMAFATGTITYRPMNVDFMAVFKDPCVQPLRKQIKANPEFFKDTIYCTSSDYMEDANLVKATEKDSRFVRFIKSVYNRSHTGQQKAYFSFNMVDAFNDYKMFIVGEEVVGQPGIGFVEGMACGGAYIGLDSPMYTDLGLIPGVHYITYDGTKEDLRRVIEYYQMDEHQAELEQIAKTGCEYVRTHFNGDTVAEKLLHDLEEQQKIWLAERKQ